MEMARASGIPASPLTIKNYWNGPLLDRAADLREYVVGIRPNQTNRAHDDDENYRQHDGIFRDVLATLIFPELL